MPTIPQGGENMTTIRHSCDSWQANSRGVRGYFYAAERKLSFAKMKKLASLPARPLHKGDKKPIRFNYQAPGFALWQGRKSEYLLRILNTFVFVAKQCRGLPQSGVKYAINFVHDKIGNFLVESMSDASGDAGQGIAVASD